MAPPRALVVPAFLVLVLAAGVAHAVAPAGSTAQAVGFVTHVETGCRYAAQVVIERGLTPDEELLLVGTGSGLLTLQFPEASQLRCGRTGFERFGGGQCFECVGSCRVWTNATAECWYQGHGDVDSPARTGDALGRYMRLDADGSFLFRSHFNIPFDPDYHYVGTMTRVG